MFQGENARNNFVVDTLNTDMLEQDEDQYYKGQREKVINEETDEDDRED